MQQFGEIIIVNFEETQSLKQFFANAEKDGKTPIVIGDSVGSMGGVAPVVELLTLAEKYKGYVYLDDAHGTSVHGKHGCGYVMKCLDYHFHPRLIIAATLGKAFGSLGGVLLLPTKEDKDFIVGFCPTYIFGGPPALSMVNVAIASAKIHLTDEIYLLQEKLWNNVDYFDSLLHGHIVNADTPSPLRGIFIGDEFEAIQFSKELRRKGFILTTAMYPTVEKQKSILRVAISALHTKEDIADLCKNIREIKKSFSDVNWLEKKSLKLQPPEQDELIWAT